MSRRLEDLRAEVLTELPAPCRSCLFWESARAPRGGVPGQEAAKEAWVKAVTLEWGAPGKAVWLDDALVAFALLAPPSELGRLRRLDRGPSPDALVLATLWIDPEVRDAGLGRVLIQSLAREAHQRGARALEAYGARLPAPTCVVPEGFLLATGFAVLHQHPNMPLLRLDLRSTVRESLAHALDAVRDALARRREAAPAPLRPAPG